MKNLKNLHDSIANERQQIIKELNELEQSEILKRYFELSEKNNELLLEQQKVLKEIKNKEYECCNHILVMTAYDYDSIEGRSEKYYGCIKCGLNENIYRKVGGGFGTDLLSIEEKIMYSYLKNRYLTGKRLNVLCELNLAMSIYNKIKENNPDIDEKTLLKYFEIALENIRDEEASNKKKEDKVKRLKF